MDADYVRAILPALEGRTMDGRKLGSVLGSSMRMAVLADEWRNPREATAHNPGRLPERTITRARVFEFGP